MVTSIIIVPLAVGVLTEAEYGVFSTLVSISIILSLADLGIANSLLTRLSIAEAAGDRREFRSDLSSAFAMTFVGATIVLLGFSFAMTLTGPRLLFGETGPIPAGTNASTFVVAAVALLRIPLSVVQIARRAQLQGRHNAVFDLLASATRLILVLLVTARGGGLHAVVLAAFVPLLVADLANLSSYRISFGDRAPQFRLATMRRIRQLVRPAFLFLLLQVTTAFSYSSGNLVVARALGVDAVQKYSVPNQIAVAGISVLTAASAQLWPAISQALAANKPEWARRLAIRATLVVGTSSGLLALAFGLAGPWFINRWSHGEVQPSTSLTIGLALWILLGSLAGLVSFILNAMQLVGLQVALSVPATIATLGVGFWWTSRSGVAGMVWATLLCAAFFVAAPSALVASRHLRNPGVATTE